MRLNLRVALLGLIALVAVGAACSSLGDAGLISSSPVGTKPKNATLVIDYGVESKRPVKTFDLVDLPSDVKGWDLFRLAKLSVQGTAQFPSGFVCRVDGWPTLANQDCADTPSYLEGHWAYFVTNSSIGPGWILSGQGAAMHKPECGGFEGWSWVSSGRQPKPPRFEVQIRGC
jgi:hypothetical protein